MSKKKIAGIIVGVVCIIAIIIVVITGLPTPEGGTDGEIPQGNSEGKIVFETAGNIHIIDPDGSNERRLAEGEGPRWSPDGKRILFHKHSSSSTGPGLYVINSEGTGETRIFAPSLSPTSWEWYDFYRWSPDGTKILVAPGLAGRERDFLDSGGGVYSVSSDGSGLIRLVEIKSQGAGFSPDGEQIVFIAREGLLEQEFSDDGHKYSLYVMNPDGTEKARIADDTLHIDYLPNLALSYSPDGTRILYGDSEGLYVINADGSNKISLITSDYHSTHEPAWSPDGRKIACIVQGTICIMNPDGTGKVEIDLPSCEALSWSPDSKKIVCGCSGDIYIVNADGSDAKNLVSGRYPNWS